MIGSNSWATSELKSPREITIPSATSKISSKCSTADLFSILAYTKASLPSFLTNSLTSLTSFAFLTNEAPIKSTCAPQANFNTWLSSFEIQGIEVSIEGTFTKQ